MRTLFPLLLLTGCVAEATEATEAAGYETAMLYCNTDLRPTKCFLRSATKFDEKTGGKVAFPNPETLNNAWDTPEQALDVLGAEGWRPWAKDHYAFYLQRGG